MGFNIGAVEKSAGKISFAQASERVLKGKMKMPGHKMKMPGHDKKPTRAPVRAPPKAPPKPEHKEMNHGSGGH